MAKFEIGEIAIGQNFIDSLHMNGEELIVAGRYGEYSGTNTQTRIRETVIGYPVKKPDGKLTHVSANRLRKKKPPQETSTWEEVQEIVNWNPKKVNDNVKI